MLGTAVALPRWAHPVQALYSPREQDTHFVQSKTEETRLTDDCEVISPKVQVKVKVVVVK